MLSLQTLLYYHQQSIIPILMHRPAMACVCMAWIMSTPELPPCQGRHSHVTHAYRPKSLPLLLLSVLVFPLQLNTGSELTPTQSPTARAQGATNCHNSAHNQGHQAANTAVAPASYTAPKQTICSTHHAALCRQPPAATGTKTYGLLTGNPSWHAQLLCCCSCSCQRLAH